jgi:primosomal replication protein N
VNRWLVSGRLVELSALRYTPAGLPVLEFILQHQSSQPVDIGRPEWSHREVTIDISGVVMGELTKQMMLLKLPCDVQLEGFLTKVNRKSKVLQLHAQKITLMSKY